MPQQARERTLYPSWFGNTVFLVCFALALSSIPAGGLLSEAYINSAEIPTQDQGLSKLIIGLSTALVGLGTAALLAIGAYAAADRLGLRRD